MPLIPIGVTSGESKKFYEKLFKNNGKMFEGKNEGKSHNPPEEPDSEYCSECGTRYTNSPKGLVCINCGTEYPGPTFPSYRFLTPAEKAGLEIEERKIETDIRGNL